MSLPVTFAVVRCLAAKQELERAQDQLIEAHDRIHRAMRGEHFTLAAERRAVALSGVLNAQAVADEIHWRLHKRGIG